MWATAEGSGPVFYRRRFYLVMWKKENSKMSIYQKRKSMAALLVLTLMVFTGCSSSSKETTKKTKKTKAETTTEKALSEEESHGFAGEEYEIDPDDGESSNETKDTKDTEGNAVTGISFSTKGRDGNTYDQSILSGCKVTMINFFEPWCGPCVSEMPDLEKLYETYKDQGFQILGVYSTLDMEEDLEQTLSSSGITYPILQMCDAFYPYVSEYVPTTVFLDENGNLLMIPGGETQKIGSSSYEDWEKIVKSLLET